MFVADDLAAWLVGLLAGAGRKKLTRLVLGNDQERALRQAATAAIESTATELDPSDDDQAAQLAMVVSEVFRDPAPDAALAGHATLLEALQAAVAERLAVLDDAAVTGTGQSSADVLGVPGCMLAETLARHLVQEIMVRGSGGGPLAPLADQLNHDVTHLQGRRLEGMLAQLVGQVRALARASSDAVASQPVRLLPRPAFLAGREELLAGLDTRLAGADAAGPRVVALCGLGGAGKTSVALEYTYRHLHELGVAWQFPAEDAAVLAASFGELAAQLGAGGLPDTRDSVASVHGVLAAFPREWLLVFDNAPDPTSVQMFLPPAGRGRVLITSRSALWPPGQALDVPVLDTDVAAAFLVSRTGDAYGQAALDLAAELGGLPLALEQAAAYIQATGDSLAGYLASFQQRRANMLARGEPIGYGKTVATTWALAFEDLQQAALGAIGLLRLLANCAPDAIPLHLLLQPRPGLGDQLAPEMAQVLVPLLEDALAAKDAIAALRRYSLISPPADGLVSVHRLIQAVTVDQMPADLAVAWRQATAAVIEAAIPQDPNEPDTWTDFAALLPHARAALPADSDCLERIAAYLSFGGSYGAACDLQRALLLARERVLGPEHQRTLISRANLARWTGEAGDAAGARDQFAALVLAFVRAFGTEHPSSLTAAAALARFTGEAGDAVGARDQLAALVPAFERVLGPEHRDTLITRANLASQTGDAGNAAGARDQFVALLPVEERVFGPEHLETLTARSNLASWTGQAGDTVGARDQYAALLPVEERVFGPEHRGTLISRANLARWTGEAGDAAWACRQFAALLPMFERVLGPEHPDSMTSRHGLARWTALAGDLAGARDQFAALLSMQERVLGPEHAATLATRSNLAALAEEEGDAAGARDQYATLLPIRERVLGPEHPDTLAACSNLAYWTGAAGDAAGARDQFAALLSMQERVLGPEHAATLATRSNLAALAEEEGDAAGARDQYATLLPIRERVLGPEHPDTLAACSNLAYWTGAAGDAAGARDQYATLLSAEERVLGPEHAATLVTRSNLAAFTGQAGDAAGARDLLAELLPACERVLGPEHPDTLSTRSNLAVFTREAGDAAGARDLMAELLPLRERILGPEHPDTLSTRANLALFIAEAGTRPVPET